MLAGLSQLNVEFSARCNAACSMCGHQSKKINPAIEHANDMEFGLMAHIATQLPMGIVVQAHKDGEPTVYPRLRDALELFEGQHRSIVTNGINLSERADEIIGNCETVCVSVFEGAEHADAQYGSTVSFLLKMGRADAILPRVIVKFVGEVSEATLRRWEAFESITRRLHAPQRNTHYRGGAPEGWEHGLCTDLLSHPSIDWRGDLFLCNRLDPTGVRRLGSLRERSLAELWDGPERAAVIRAHIEGRAGEIPQCRGCEYRGLPAV